MGDPLRALSTIGHVFMYVHMYMGEIDIDEDINSFSFSCSLPRLSGLESLKFTGQASRLETQVGVDTVVLKQNLGVWD